MKQKQYLSQAAVAMTLMLCLTGCSTDKDMESTAPSAGASPSPVVTEDTGSTMTPDGRREDRDSGAEDSAADRPNAETPAASENPSTHEEGAQAAEDMKQAGENLGDAAQNAGRSIENGLKGQ